MTDDLKSEIATNHRYWLVELERWDGYVRTWLQQQERLETEMAEIIRNHGELLRQHARAIEGLRHEIAECERKMAAGQSLSEMEDHHRAGVARHEEQRDVHERLKKTHHTLMAALSMLKGQPIREE